MSVRVITGDCRDVLRTLPTESVHCVVSSPPYWALRDYGIDGQLGLEPSLGEYVVVMVDVFREVRRLLRSDGTLWLNLGSSYASGDTSATQSRQRERVLAYGSDGKARPNCSVFDSACSDLCDECLTDFLSHHGHMLGNDQQPAQEPLLASLISRGNGHSDCASTIQDVLPRDVPVSTMIESWRQLRGACFRCDKRASGLSAVRSSFCDAQAFVRSSWLNYATKPKDLLPIPWLVALALQADGWWLRQDIIWSKPNPMPESVTDRCTKAHEYIFLMSKSERYYYDAAAIAEAAGYDPANTKFPDGWDTGAGGHGSFHRNGREKGRAAGYKSHKYVTEYLASDSEEHRTKAGLMKIADVAYPTRNKRSVWEIATQSFSEAHFATFPPALIEPCILAGCPRGGTVLDPFGGAGTTGLVADRLGRNAILIELKPEYAEMARRRITDDAPLFAELTT